MEDFNRKPFPADELEKMLPAEREALLQKDFETKSLVYSMMCAKLTPKGNPDFSILRDRPWIKNMEQQYGAHRVLAALIVIISNFNKMLGVVRPMTAIQINDCAVHLLNEAGNYRIEDYVMMFTMAKAGKLGKIMDRIDLEMVCRFHEEYDRLRSDYGQRMQEEQVRQEEKKLLSDPPPPDHDPTQKFDITEVLEKYKKIQLESRVAYVENLENKEYKMFEKRLAEATESGKPEDVPLIDLRAFATKKNKSPPQNNNT